LVHYKSAYDDNDDDEPKATNFTVSIVFLSITKMLSTLNPIGSPFRRFKNIFTYENNPGISFPSVTLC